jgi:hypothetical protein
MRRVGLKDVFENIFWPAAAGNVLWGFCTVAVRTLPDGTEYAAQLFVLLIIGCYLVFGWAHLRGARGKIAGRFWGFEACHLLIMSLAAIAASESGRQGAFQLLLGAYFAVTIAGHLFGAWKFPGDLPHPKRMLVAANAAGLLLLAFGGWLGLGDDWRVSLSFALAFVLWLWARRKDLLALFTAPPEPRGAAP